ncbi:MULTISPECIES: winged helix-turn-helix domain-containing protein [Saliphagus]|uniref:Winged helix-turn-helix transcriptional regulator n=1 Tax=Saliphagus infecundisoli TaxID=1849069 RepID=A0ABD5QAW1_9EURY|nr:MULTISPECIES: winged helix-turn-helix domain-containing protein [Saliphagus]
MKLRQPTDFLILEALEERGRNVATNLQAHTGKSRQNINTRLPVLADYGLIRKIGPAERSGLYEITPNGKAALIHREKYGEVDDFEALLEGPTAEIDDQAGAAGFARCESEDGDSE